MNSENSVEMYIGPLELLVFLEYRGEKREIECINDARRSLFLAL